MWDNCERAVSKLDENKLRATTRACDRPGNLLGCATDFYDSTMQQSLGTPDNRQRLVRFMSVSEATRRSAANLGLLVFLFA